MLLNAFVPLPVFIFPIKVPERRFREYIFEDNNIKRKYKKSYKSSILSLRMMHTLLFQLFPFFIMFSNIFRFPIA